MYRNDVHPAPIFILALALAALLAAMPAAAQEAETVPTSDTLITLEVALPDGETIQATVPEGGMVRVELDDGQRILGLTPQLGDADGKLAVTIFDINKLSADRETIKELKAVDVPRDAGAKVEDVLKDGVLDVALVSVRRVL